MMLIDNLKARMDNLDQGELGILCLHASPVSSIDAWMCSVGVVASNRLRSIVARFAALGSEGRDDDTTQHLSIHPSI